jgi:hypothetical protein
MYRRVVFVRNLPRNTTAADCQALFAPYGRVLKLWLGTRPDVAGSAYAALPSREQALDAVNGLTGRPMQVSPRCARAARSAHEAHLPPTRRVRLVWRDGRDVSTLYEREGGGLASASPAAQSSPAAASAARRTPRPRRAPRAAHTERGAGVELVWVSPPARRAACARVRV